MEGKFARLNGQMVKNGRGAGNIISIVGEMISCDGTYLTLKASDGVPLIYAIDPDFEYGQVRGTAALVDVVTPSNMYMDRMIILMINIWTV